MTSTRIVGSLRRAEDGKGIVRMEDLYDTDIDDLWSALTDPGRLARWIVEVDGDLRPGGRIQARFTSSWVGPGRIDVCEAPHHLAVTLSPGAGDETVIDAVLVAEQDRTRLVIEERGIPVANLPGFNTDAVADWTLGAMLSLLRRYTAGHAKIADGGWGPEGLRGRDLSALTVGVLGFGNIGRAVARRLDGFGARVIVHDPVRSEPDREYLDLDALLPRADILSVHLPLNDRTRNVLDEKALALLPQGAYVVNAGRGGVLDEDALVRLLDTGHLAGAALDVFAEEPLPAASALRGRSDVLLNPHSAGVTHEAYHNLRGRLIEQLDRVLSGRPPANVVNGVHPAPAH